MWNVRWLYSCYCLFPEQAALKRNMSSNHDQLYASSDSSSGKLASKCRRIDLNNSHSPSNSSFDFISAVQRDDDDSDSGGGRKCAGTQTYELL